MDQGAIGTTIILIYYVTYIEFFSKSHMITHPLANRIQKRWMHLKKWAKRELVTCFRVYEKDLTDYPLILDWYDGEAVVWLYERTRDETDAQQDAFQAEVMQGVSEALSLPLSQIHLKSRYRQKGLQSQYEKVAYSGQTRVVREGGLKFEVNLHDYLDTGLFLDHRITRRMCREMAAGTRFLNLFAYTGSFTCYARDGGAAATATVDLNANYSEWTRRNLALNGVSSRPSDRVITQDCISFLKEESALNPRGYDLIVCDPPTFSNSKKMKAGSFSVDEDYPYLLRHCVRLLAPGGIVIFSTNSQKFRMDLSQVPASLRVEEITAKTRPPDFRNPKIHRCWKLV